ncbi:MAG TPA: YcnI family protein [Microlunatus sp.]|nr:YcnI family protein [Microlunatus sp.]
MNQLSPRSTRRRRPVLALAGLAAAGLTLLTATTADAHVRAVADNPTSGGFSAVTFRVPNESDTAGTVELSVQLPTDTPFVYVSSKPVPGWTVTAPKEKLPEPVDLDGTTITEAVRTVTWTAQEGTRIEPGEYQEFSVSVGPLPEPGTILLPATQTYSDGEVVAWDQPAPASGEEPEHPAPEIEVVAAPAGSDHHGGESSDLVDAPDPTASDPVARVLGSLGLVAGIGALVVSLVALRRRSA